MALRFKAPCHSIILKCLISKLLKISVAIIILELSTSCWSISLKFTQRPARQPRSLLPTTRLYRFYHPLHPTPLELYIEGWKGSSWWRAGGRATSNTSRRPVHPILCPRGRTLCRQIFRVATFVETNCFKCILGAFYFPIFNGQRQASHPQPRWKTRQLPPTYKAIIFTECIRLYVSSDSPSEGMKHECYSANGLQVIKLLLNRITFSPESLL